MYGRLHPSSTIGSFLLVILVSYNILLKVTIPQDRSLTNALILDGYKWVQTGLKKKKVSHMPLPYVNLHSQSEESGGVTWHFPASSAPYKQEVGCQRGGAYLVYPLIGTSRGKK